MPTFASIRSFWHIVTECPLLWQIIRSSLDEVSARKWKCNQTSEKCFRTAIYSVIHCQICIFFDFRIEEYGKKEELRLLPMRRLICQLLRMDHTSSPKMAEQTLLRIQQNGWYRRLLVHLNIISSLSLKSAIHPRIMQLTNKSLSAATCVDMPFLCIMLYFQALLSYKLLLVSHRWITTANRWTIKIVVNHLMYYAIASFGQIMLQVILVKNCILIQYEVHDMKCIGYGRNMNKERDPDCVYTFDMLSSLCRILKAVYPATIIVNYTPLSIISFCHCSSRASAGLYGVAFTCARVLSDLWAQK